MPPLNVGLAVSRLALAIDELCEQSMGYKPSEQIRLARYVVLLMLVLRRNPRSKQTKKELNECLDRWEKEYGWQE